MFTETAVKSTAIVSYPEFSSRCPWFGSDLQTIRNTLRGPSLRADAFQSKRLYLSLHDGSGDALATLYQTPDKETGKPLVVLIHGLTGHEESFYMETSAAYCLYRGYPVIRINLRGSGPSRNTCRLMYHAGRSKDLRDALTSLPDDLQNRDLFIIGFSLGGNMLLKFTAEFGSQFPLLAITSVSAPIDLLACSMQMLKFRNTLYTRYILKCLKEDTLGGTAEVTEKERQAVLQSRSVYEFDTVFMAPRNSYSSAEDYYEQNKALKFLGSIRTPALLIHALNDPWIPGKAYIDYPWHSNKFLFHLLPKDGGHVGFHGKDSAVPWHDRCIGKFFEYVISP